MPRHEGRSMSSTIRKSVLAGCALLAGAAGLAACSQSSSPSATSGEASAPSSASATPVTPPAPAGTSAAATMSANVEGTRLLRFPRSEEHTSELQSHVNLVCRLLLEKKKKKKNIQ